MFHGKGRGRPPKNSPMHIEIAQLAQNALSTKFYQEAEARIPRKTIGDTYFLTCYGVLQVTGP